MNCYILNVSNLNPISLKVISKFEKICNIKLTNSEKVLLVNTGITEQILGMLLNSTTHINVEFQLETNTVIKRRVQIISDINNQILVEANSKIYKKNIPSEIIDGIRSKQTGIGMLMIKYKLDIFKKIIKIGYNPSKSTIFRIYKIIHNKQTICDINEVFVSRFNEIK